MKDLSGVSYYCFLMLNPSDNRSLLGSQVLCKIQPYHEISRELQVVEQIRKGRPPSDRPRGPRASLINDALWSAISSCWQAQDWRPTSRAFLDRLIQMLENQEILSSPALPDYFPSGGEQMESWPDEFADLRDQIEIDSGMEAISSSVCAEVWL